MMAGEALAALQTIQMLQMAFINFESAVGFGSFFCPIDTPIENITSIKYFNFIIVGGGTAGSVLANRLSQCPYASVLLIEEGGCPPLESDFLYYFPILPQTMYDYNMTSVNDHHALQNLQNNVAGITVGRMLGGGSSIQHTLHVRGSIPDYDPWAVAANDSSWSYERLLPYFKRSENVLDKNVVREYKQFHGTCGPTKVKKQPSPRNTEILESFSELNYTIRSDTNNDDTLGATEPMLTVDKTYRQSTLVSYIYPVKNRKNLYILTSATVTKIIFSEKKVAIGVQFTFKGASYSVYSKDEVIVSAGAIKTPQLLMLSGVGSSDHLKSKDIPVISNLPVGKNLHDHVSAPIIIALDKDSSPTPTLDRSQFPAPMTCNYDNLDNKSAGFAQFQGINLVISHDNPDFMSLCLNAFKYTVEICQKWYDANIGRNVWFIVPTLLRPCSRGQLLLNTTNINDQPLINVGYLSNKTDTVNLARFLGSMLKILNTKYFKKVEAKFVDMGVCSQHKKFSVKFLECYAVAMSSTMWHYCGTAAMGSVVDGKLNVKGVTKLRVVDASIIPVVPGGNINAAVLAIAEKAADIIRSAYKYYCC